MLQIRLFQGIRVPGGDFGMADWNFFRLKIGTVRSRLQIREKGSAAPL